MDTTAETTPARTPAPQQQVTSRRLLEEAEGAHTVARKVDTATQEVLRLLQTPQDGDQTDPLAPILATLEALALGQALILRRLDSLQQGQHGEPSPGSAA